MQDLLTFLPPQLAEEIPRLESYISSTKLLQDELKANITAAKSCRHIGPTPSQTLECVDPGSHVLWDGLGALFGTDGDSYFNFLTFSYMPIDATVIGSILVASLGAAYGFFMYTMLIAPQAKASNSGSK